MSETKEKFGVFVRGRLVHEETTTKKTKSGSDVTTRTASIDVGGMQNILVDVPLKFVFKKDKDDVVELEVKTSAKTWDNVEKRFGYVQVKYYIPSDN